MSKYQKWDNNLQEYASEMEVKYSLPSGSLHQIVQQESRGNLGLTSKAGAYGLTQLMPGTAKEMGVTNPSDPYQQLEGGAKYFGQLLNGPAKGDEIIAAAMYNSGPNKKAYKTGNLNLLPTETQNYMKAYATARGGQVEEPKTIGGKIANAIIPPAYGESTTPAKKVLTPEEFDALPDTAPVTKKVLTPEEFAALPDTAPTETKRPNLFEKPITDLPSYLKKQQLMLQAAHNILPSAVELGKGTFLAGVNAVAQTVDNPMTIPTGISNLIQGEIYKYNPDLVTQKTNEFGPESVQQAQQTASNVNQAFYNRFGTGENLTNTIVNDPVGLMSDATSFGLLSKVGFLPARSTIDLVPHPISGGADIISNSLGRGATNALATLNKSNLTKTDIKKAYNAGKGDGGTFANTVSNKTLLPDWENMTDAEKLSLVGSIGLLTPKSAALFSPKLVAGTAYGVGAARRVPAAINKAMDITPGKGVLNQYENEQQNNPIREHIRKLIDANF